MVDLLLVFLIYLLHEHNLHNFYKKGICNIYLLQYCHAVNCSTTSGF